MQTFTQIFGGGGAANKWRLEVPGRYLVLLVAAQAVSIKLFYQGKQLRLGQIDQWTTGPLAGLQIGPLPADANGIAFDAVEITPTAADTCVVGIGDGSVVYNRAAGSVSVIGPLLGDNADAQAAAGASSLIGVVARLMGWNGATFDRIKIGAVAGSVLADIADRAARLVGIVAGTLGSLVQAVIGGVNALVVTERGAAYGAAFGSNTAIASATNETAVAPATNVNGLIVWAASICTGSTGGNTQLGLLAKASAPTGGVDGDVLLMAQSLFSTSVGWGGPLVELPRPVFVPAGKGLYFRNSGAAAESIGQRRLLYTVL